MKTEHNEPDTLDLRAYLRPIWRRKWLVVVIVVIAGAATYFISSREQKQYTASTAIYVQSANPAAGLTGPASQPQLTPTSVADVAQLILSQPVSNAVAARLRMPVSSAGTVTASPANGSDFVTLTATSHRPALAARLANTFVSMFLRSRSSAVTAAALKSERAAQVTLASLPNNPASYADITQRATVLSQIESYRQTALNPSPGAQQVASAAVPRLPSSPQPKRDAIFGAVVGLVLGLIAVFCIELLDRRLQSADTVESVFGRPVLAVLPHVPDPTPLIDDHAVVPAHFVEELRSLTVIVRLSTEGDAPRTIMITSTLPREGKSTVTRDLALVYAASGKRVLVIDADLRRPSMEALFGIEATSGLAQILRGTASLSEAAVTAIGTPHRAKVPSNGSGEARLDALLRWPDEPPATGGPGSVDVVAHGERLDNPLAVLSSQRMWSLLDEASNVYDMVLVDTPPVLTVADCVPLMEVVDGVLLVARLGQTTRRSGDRFQSLLDRLSNVNFIGVVANDRRGHSDEDGYGSYGRYGYAYGNDTKRSERKQQDPTTAS